MSKVQTKEGGVGAAGSAPVPFICVESDGSFHVDEKAVDKLSKINGKIAIVAVAGLYRTGKSFLLNLLVNPSTIDQKLLKQPSHLTASATPTLTLTPPHDQTTSLLAETPVGFAVGGTVQACTKGIWMWGEPIVLEDGTSVIFLDTEGLGSVDREQTHDTRLFALALLLASYFVYNSRGVIDGNAIEDLSLVVNLSKHIQTSTHQQTNPNMLAEYFPTFLWVVRDFTLQLLENGQEISSKQYFDNALKPQNGLSSDIASKNQIRSLLTDFFRERDCFTLVRPVENESDLRLLPTIPYTNLRSEFRSKFENMQQRIYQKAQPKTLFNKTLNGSMFAHLAQQYCEALNSGKAPVIANAWQQVVQNQCENAVFNAITQYEQEMQTRIIEYIPNSKQFINRIPLQTIQQLSTLNSNTNNTGSDPPSQSTSDDDVSNTITSTNSIIDNGQGNVAKFDENGNLIRYNRNSIAKVVKDTTTLFHPTKEQVDISTTSTTSQNETSTTTSYDGDELVKPTKGRNTKKDANSVRLPVPVEEITAIHNECVQIVSKILHDADIKDQEEMKTHKDAFQSGIQTILETFHQKNAAASMLYCNALLEYLKCHLLINTDDNTTTTTTTSSSTSYSNYFQQSTSYLSNLNTVYAMYAEHAIGPCIDAAYCQFMSQTVLNQIITFTEQSSKSHFQEMKLLQTELNTLTVHVASAQGQATAMNELAQQEALKYESNLREAERKSKSEIDALHSTLEYKTHELEHVLNHNATLRRLADTAQQTNFRATEAITHAKNGHSNTFSGYLIQQNGANTNSSSSHSNSRSKYQQRFFVLQFHELSIYNTKDDYERGRTDDIPIDISNTTIEENRNIAEAFAIHFPTTSTNRIVMPSLHLHAKTKQLQQEWIEQILKASRLGSNSATSQYGGGGSGANSQYANHQNNTRSNQHAAYYQQSKASSNGSSSGYNF